MRETLSFELDTVPDLTSVIAAYPQQYPFLLDSVANGPLGRYSMAFRASDEFLCLNAHGVLTGPGQEPGFLERLNTWYQKEASPSQINQDFPFCGGWFVYLAYELAGEIEPKLNLPAAVDNLPVALAVRCKGALIIDHLGEGSATLVAESRQLLDQMILEISSLPEELSRPTKSVNALIPDDGDEFVSAVSKIKRYLEAGDVFQVNLSRAWNGDFDERINPVDIYRRLRKGNPAPFSGMMMWEGSALLSSSPERLVEVRGQQVQTRPIAGTYPRSTNTDSDRALSRDMLEHPKERAEHIMLIDLERNDLGRVCEAGSVEVSELMVLESYAHVHHIVSNVKGKLRENITPPDVIRAVFPGGTITGCPKVRCMEIIAELENTGRGFYTGSMGYISLDGQMDTNILIRSMILHDRKVSLRTGAGIVADSKPQSELAETEAKAKGLLLTLEGSDA